jgi:hypothetical protein
MKPAGPGGPPPLSEEWFIQQKKLLKQAGMDKTSAAEAAHDTYTPSPEAAKLPATRQEKFLASAKAEILKMDYSSEEFVPDATRRLVDTALEQEFGQEIISKPGYAQMQHKITRTILEDERYREMMEEFLSLLVLSAQPREDREEEGQGQPAPEEEVEEPPAEGEPHQA